MRTSRILKDYKQNGMASCAMVKLGDPRCVELAGLAGFSAVWVCNEHDPGDWRLIDNHVRAGKVHDVDIIVRVSKGSYSDYIKAFECDAAAIMVPHVASADEARAIVDMCRFRPLGNRALDGGNIDGAFCQTPAAEYIEASNREKLIILQIESPEAVEKVDEIAAVEGYNFLLFGPGDYCHRIGKPGQVQHPEVAAARKHVEAAMKKHGKLGFAVGLGGTPVPEVHDRGYAIMALGADVVYIGQGMKASIAAFRDNLPKKDPYYGNDK